MFADRYRGKEHHEQDREQILHHQDAKDNARESLIAKSHIVECLKNDRRRRHGKHSTEEETVHVSPTQCQPRGITSCHHANDDSDSSDYGRSAYLHQLFETEIESQGEQQEDHTDVCPDADTFHLGDRRDLFNGGPGQDAGDDIPQNHGLFQLLEQEGD